jgi:hypothetical protein
LADCRSFGLHLRDHGMIDDRHSVLWLTVAMGGTNSLAAASPRLHGCCWRFAMRPVSIILLALAFGISLVGCANIHPAAEASVHTNPGNK